MPHIEGFWEIETSGGDIWRLQYPAGGLMAMSGVGLPQATYATQKAPGQHGDSHLGYVLNPRTVLLRAAWKCLWESGTYNDGLWRRRIASPYPHLNYLSNPLILRRVFKDGITRELWNVWYVGGVERSSDSGDNRVETSAIELVARDPVWYDPDEDEYEIELEDMETGDELVFDTPGGVAGPTAIFSDSMSAPPVPLDYLTFGSSTINITLNSGEIATAGDWYTFPTITIVGPASYPEIENETSGYIITMDYDIPIGRTVTFDLRYGYKTVTDDLGTNLAGYVPATDDLADFCLWPAPLAANGENDIRLFCGGATGATSITIEWYDRYLGV